jgi:hypothetical protein
MQPVLTFGLPRRLCLIGRLEASPLSVPVGDDDLPWVCEGLGRGEIWTFPAGTVMVEVEDLGLDILGKYLNIKQPNGVQEFKLQATRRGRVG